MTQEFGNAGDHTGEESNSGGFGSDGQTNPEGGSSLDITAEELAALRKRDGEAQAFIERLKTENADLREQKAELGNALASATTLDDVIERIGSGGGSQSTNAPLDLDSAVEQVEQRFQERANKQVADKNWNDVYTRVTEVYGNWDKANEEIQRRASELNMSSQEATDLARRSPAAFFELYIPKGTQTPTQSSARSAGGQITSAHTSEGKSEQELREYYKQLRRENPRKYWTPEVQAQYRRDLHGA